MKYIRTKKLVFLNNKWWVGKTTLAFNTAVKFAEKWYKTVIMDLDPQCNISKLALWEQFAENLLSNNENNIYGVLKWVIDGGADININLQFLPLRENLSILPGSLKLSRYQDALITSYTQATAGIEIGYFQTSAISRFLLQKWLKEDIDIFIIDASPSLELLNRIILLGSDYFITPLMPDIFSVQGIENLGITLANWKEDWKNSAKLMAKTRDIPSNRVLDWEALFIWYIVNSYNQYGQQPIKSHRERMERIPQLVKENLSEKHSKNGLVEQSRRNSLMEIKDYGELPTDGQRENKAIFELIPGKDFQSVPWTLDNRELSKQQFELLFENINAILSKY